MGTIAAAEGYSGVIEVGHDSTVGRPNGKSGGDNGKRLGDTLAEPRLHRLASDYECDPADLFFIGEAGLRGSPSPAQCKRIGRACQIIGERCAWTFGDCANILRDSAKSGEGDKESVVSYEVIAGWFGSTADRVEKAAVAARAWEKDKRHSRLSFAHHAEAACLTTEYREQVLAQSEAEGLTIARLRDVVRALPDDSRRNATGRKRSAILPNPANVPTPPPAVTIARAVPLNPTPATESTPASPLSSANGTGYVPDPDPAPNGKTPPPSIAPLAQRLVLQDRKLCAEILGLASGDITTAEIMLGDIVRAFLKLSNPN